MDIKSRIERAIIFKNYLDKVWLENNLNSPHFNWPTFSNELQLDIDKIKHKIEKRDQESKRPNQV